MLTKILTSMLIITIVAVLMTLAGEVYAVTYTLNVTANNCTVVKNPDQPTYDAGTKVTLTATPNPGYMLTGWTGSATSSTNPTTITMDADKSITVSYEPIGDITVAPRKDKSACVNLRIHPSEIGETNITFFLPQVTKDGMQMLYRWNPYQDSWRQYQGMRDLLFNINTGVLLWYPRPTQSGIYEFTFQARNLRRAKYTKLVNITVITPPIVNGSDAFSNFMKNEAVNPRGYTGIVYRNADSGHAVLGTGWSDQVDSIPGGMGLQIMGGYPSEVTFTNSSTAYSGLGGDNTSSAMMIYTAPVYASFTNTMSPLFGFYPGHTSDGRLGQEGHVGKFIYTYTSIGSSGSEMSAIDAYIRTAGAFRKEVFELLKESGALMAAISMIDRFERVGQDEVRYMSAEAHPSFFSNTGLNMLNMVKAANAMTIQTVPPLPQIKLTSYPVLGINGVNYFEAMTFKDEIKFETPMAIATLYRDTRPLTRVFEIDASASFSPNGAAITEYNWVVTRGDPAKIRIIPLNAEISRVRIEIDYHPEAPVPYREGVTSNLVEVALFVRNANGKLSPPAFFTSYSMRNEERIIENGRLKEVLYNTNVVPRFGFYTPISYSKEWARDVYNYDANGVYLGWERYMPDNTVTSYTSDGKMIIERDASGNPTVVKNVKYSYNVSKNRIVAKAVNSYTITATAGEGGSIDPSGDVIMDEGSTKFFFITPNAGYRILDVSVDGISQGAVRSHAFQNVTANHTITTTFGVGSIINASALTGGTISPSGDVVIERGADATFTVTPNERYKIWDVFVDGVSQGAVTSYTFKNVTSGHSIIAKFMGANQHIIAIINKENGRISPAVVISPVDGGGDDYSPLVIVDHGSDKTFTIFPNEGYEVGNVSVDGVSQGAVTSYTFTNVTSDHTITATFVLPNQYVITTIAGNGGAITPSGDVIVGEGESQTFSIQPDQGYQIEDVKVDNVSQGKVASYTFNNILMNYSIDASFSQAAAGPVQPTERAIWVWSMADDVVLDAPAGSRAAFFSFCDAPHGDSGKAIKIIYLSGVVPGKDLVGSYAVILRGFLAAAHSRGLKVECLYGDKSWATPEYRQEGEAKCDEVINFNKNGASDAERFDGVHFDVEPYLLKFSRGDAYDWDKDNTLVWLEYLKLLENCQAKVNAYNATYTDIKFGAAIPWWYDADNYAGRPDEIQDRVDYITLMDYRETAQMLVDAAVGELNYARTLGKKVYVGVETAQARPPDPETITFYEEGNTYMEQQLGEAANTFNTYSSFGGFAIHYYEDADNGERAYRRLWTDSFPGYHPIVEVVFPNGTEGIELKPGLTYNIKWTAADLDTDYADLRIDIKYSSDGGVTWNNLAANEANDGAYSWNTAGFTDGTQYKIKVTATDPGSLSGYDTSDYNFAFSSTPSIVGDWTSGQNTGINGIRPIIIPDGDILHMAWYWPGWGGMAKGVYYKKSADKGSSWGQTITLAEDNTNEPRKPALAVRGDNVAVAWVEGAGTNGAQKVKVRVSTDGGNSWGAAEEVQGNYSGFKWADFPDISIDSGNVVHVVWAAREIAANNLWVLHYNSRSSGGAWSDRFTVNERIYYLSTPSITSDANGTHVAMGEFNWQSGWKWYIKYRRKTGGGWDAGKTIASGAASNDVWTKYFPRIYSDASNKLHLVWQTAGDNPQTDSPPITSDIYYSSSSNAGGSWSSAVYIGDGYVPMVSSVAGDMRVIYYQPSSTEELGTLRYRKSADGGNTWAAEANITTDARMPYWHSDVPIIVGIPFIASDASDNMIAAWRGYSNDRIMFSYNAVLSPPLNLFANLPAASSTSIKLTWERPDGYTPEHYSLYRSRNDEAFSLLASPIYDLKYTDTGLSAASYYKYKVSATEGANESLFSRVSNALYPGSEFLVDYFEVFEGLVYSKAGTSALTWAYNTSDKQEGAQSMRLDYVYSGSGWGAALKAELPAKSDISSYNAVRFWVKSFSRGNGDVNGDGVVANNDVLMVVNYLNTGGGLTPEELSRADVNGDSQVTNTDSLIMINYVNKFGSGSPPIPTGISFQLIEKGGGGGADEVWQSPSIWIASNGWTEYELPFSDFIKVDPGGDVGNFRLDVLAIGAYGLAFGSYTPGGAYYVDKVRFVRTGAIISIAPGPEPDGSYKFQPDPLVGSISNHRFILGPMSITYSGFDSPWTIRVWTNNGAGPSQAGLKGADGVTYVPLKVWCVNFGPTTRVPDEENDYFYTGYDFGNGVNIGRQYQDGDKDDWYSSGTFDEAYWEFDINGNGSTTDVITATANNKIGEEPFWLRIPEDDEMDSQNRFTWRRVAWAPGAFLNSPFDIYLAIDVAGTRNQRYRTTTLTLEFINE